MSNPPLDPENESAGDPQSNPPQSNGSDKVSFFAELKRRKVFRVAITYAVVAWLIIQIASATFGWFDIPAWAFRFVTIMLLMGFPIAVIITWAFELTPSGLKLTKNLNEDERAKATVAHEKKRNWTALSFAAGLPTLIFGTLAFYFYFQNPEPNELPGTVVPRFEVSSKSIAVLPFANMSEDPEASSFFADGVHEDLLTNLAYVSELSVSSRTSVMAYRETTKSIRQIGEELGVGNLLEGSVRRAGNRVRVTAQLIDAKTDEHIWAQSYDRNLEDIFAIQSELAKAITDALRIALTDQETDNLEKRPTSNLAAYDLVLKHRELVKRDGNTPDRQTESISLLQRAVTLDPDFAEAWAELAAVYAQSYFWYYERSSERLDQATQAIEHAKRLAPDNLNVIAFSGDYYYYGFRDYAKASNSYERVLEAAPNHVGALASVGFIRRREGQWAESIRWHRRVLEIDPRNVTVLTGLQTTYRTMRHFDEAIEMAETLYALDPSNLLNEFLLTLYLGARDGTWQPLEEFTKRYENLDARTVRELNWALQPLYVRDRDWDRVRELLEHNDYESPTSLKNRLAVVYRELGEEEKAREMLEENIATLRNRLDEKPQDLIVLMDLARGLAFSGKDKEAQETIEELKAQFRLIEDAHDGNLWRYEEAIMLAWTGRKKESIAALRELTQYPWVDGSALFVSIDLALMPLWEEPEFIEFCNDESAWAPLPIE
ncbi:tetratricopeptide repeat domain protein [Verrucomicrobiia bacterium DG1235]|nr:tetratricopeptide repeat domain protein [Verrucomicrobiae bacterium DG1235]